MRALESRKITKEQFIEICKNNDINKAMYVLNMHSTTFRKYAKLFNCYYPNYGGKGKSKNIKPQIWDLNKWNNNELLVISRSTLRKWIFKLDLLPKKCNKCKLDNWLDNDIPLELNHINGKGHDNRRTNIELLCPNCHALTDTYKGKNHKKIPKIKEKNIKKGLKNKPKPQKLKLRKNKKGLIRTRKQFFEDRKNDLLKEKEPLIKLIKESNINFNKRGWRVKVSEITGMTPQYSYNFMKNYIPELLK